MVPRCLPNTVGTIRASSRHLRQTLPQRAGRLEWHGSGSGERAGLLDAPFVRFLVRKLLTIEPRNHCWRKTIGFSDTATTGDKGEFFSIGGFMVLVRTDDVDLGAKGSVELLR
jgi:hypothetical protein